MKKLMCLAALVAMLLPGLTSAYDRLVLCEGCGESEYRQIAIQASGFNDVVLVSDSQNSNLRKFVVTSFETKDGGAFSKTAFSIAPDEIDWKLFSDSQDVYDKYVSTLEVCGPGEGIGDWLVPDLDFDSACAAHDRCYQRGGDDTDREFCDRRFYRELRLLGASLPVATAYYLAVRSGGWMFFNYQRTGGWTSTNPLFGCNFLMVCVYTSMVQTSE